MSLLSNRKISLNIFLFCQDEQPRVSRAPGSRAVTGAQLVSFICAVFLITGTTAVAAETSFQNKIVDEIDISGTGYYGRLILADDFNKDGKDEILYMRMSQKYLDYVWKPMATKKNDKPYHKKGVKLSKSPDWFASFVPYTLKPDHSRGAYWNAKFNGEVGCIHPAQILPAHLNQDEYLDFVIPCHGYDAIPFPGEHSIVALSDGPNNYNVSRFTKEPGFYHDGATADFNGDGHTDILLADMAKAKKFRVFLNDGNGKFSKSDKYFPQFSKWHGAYNTVILDVNEDGHFDVLAFGHEESNWKPFRSIILLGNAQNKFSTKNKLTIPPVKGWGTVMDVFKEGTNLFVLRSSANPRYRGAMIQQVDIATMTTIKTLKNSEMPWYSRIFRKNSGNGRVKFGGLTNEQNELDFVLDNNQIRLAD